MKKIVLLVLAVVFTASCTKDIQDLNKNEKDPTQVSGESLFASAEKDLADQMLSPSVNRNNLRLWAQYWQEDIYTDESNYDQVTRSIPDFHWQTMYRDVLNNLKRAHKIIDETDNELTNNLKTNKLAIIELLQVYTYSNLVETYGDIPYNDALNIDNTLPKFGDAATVYEDLLKRLDAALAKMDNNESFSGTEDLIYSGDIESWKKFGNTLKLRMGMVLADVNPTLSKSTVNAAIQAGVFKSNADNAAYHYPGDVPNNNPVNNELVVSGRNDFVIATTLADKMNDLQDPRRTAYFNPNINTKLGTVQSVNGNTVTVDAFAETPEVGNAVFVADGGPYVGTIKSVGSNSFDLKYAGTSPSAGDALIVAQYLGNPIGVGGDVYDTKTHVNSNLLQADRPGIILSYVETEFLLAEAAARTGYDVTKTAKFYYDEGINASFKKWDLASDAADYLAKPEVDYATALSASTSSPAWKEVIGTQAWLALYNRTFASYLSIRRLDYPLLTEPAEAESGFPVRYTYPVNEQNLNGDNYDAAANAIGGDKPETKLFWDKFYTFDF